MNHSQEDRVLLFGQLLQSYRESKTSMSRSALAKTINKSPQFIAALESNNKTPSIDTLRDIVKTLQLNAFDRHRLIDTFFELDMEGIKPMIRYEENNIIVLLEHILATDNTISRQELDFLFAMQEKFSHVLSINFIRSLLEEQRCNISNNT